ncbi:hypothetical protein JTE90_005576 [Oedothorax gibbosus]|uniref:RING-type domain-containing protein n=1 Tax=Oedothorax gibbosus TaxID=931172 RepID=A0AAV6V9A0_9ARAC|nr:hypothetical protein JTE90_005576 [Oedothorax gibbosus]
MTQKPLVIKGTSKLGEVPQSTYKSTVSIDDSKTEQATPQEIIDSLSRYSVRKNGAYLTSDCLCGVCQRKFYVGNYIVCLPYCQHTFHEYCIENWLKWVRPSCPIDKKSVIRHSYWTDIENEWFKSKYLTVSEEENGTTSNADRNPTALEEPIRVTSSQNISSPAKGKQLINNHSYPIVVSNIPLLKRFCYYMNSDGCAANKSQNETLKFPLPKEFHVHEQKTQTIHKSDTVVSKKKKINASSIQSCFKTDYLPQISNDRLPHNWIASRSQANTKADVREIQRVARFAEIKRSGGPYLYNERLDKPKIVVRRPVTFANAFE